jgi:hypothetical protein
MSVEDLERLTHMKRYSKQVEWFKRHFRIDVATGSDGSPVITWATFEALQARKYRLSTEPVPEERAPLRSTILKTVR